MTCRFLDTMSLHIVVNGMTSGQRMRKQMKDVGESIQSLEVTFVTKIPYGNSLKNVTYGGDHRYLIVVDCSSANLSLPN